MVAGVVALTVVALGPNESQAGNAVTSTDLDVVQAVSNDAIISEITVRYKPGIERLDSDGRPTGTGDIEGFSFLFGDDYPNNIASSESVNDIRGSVCNLSSHTGFWHR
jgi:hypothetical protein